MLGYEITSQPHAFSDAIVRVDGMFVDVGQHRQHASHQQKRQHSE